MSEVEPTSSRGSGPYLCLLEAVARPGRCAALHEFDRLGVEEANAWLAVRGARVKVTHPATIAELHATLDGWAGPHTKTIGFDAAGTAR